MHGDHIEKPKPAVQANVVFLTYTTEPSRPYLAAVRGVLTLDHMGQPFSLIPKVTEDPILLSAFHVRGTPGGSHTPLFDGEPSSAKRVFVGVTWRRVKGYGLVPVDYRRNMFNIERQMGLLHYVVAIAHSQTLWYVGRALAAVPAEDLNEHINRLALKESTERRGLLYGRRICILVACFNDLLKLQKMGWQHGDVKPENLRIAEITAENKLKVRLIDYDFCIPPKARMVRRQGTSMYIAPEVLGETYSQTIDVHAMAYLMFELLFPHDYGALDDRLRSSVEMVSFANVIDLWRPRRKPEYPFFSAEQQRQSIALIQAMARVNPTERPTMDEAARRLINIFPEQTPRLQRKMAKLFGPPQTLDMASPGPETLQPFYAAGAAAGAGREPSAGAGSGVSAADSAEAAK